jgi:serine/threonine protein kinase
MVDFMFEREGILVKGKWFPILRMDWVEGTPLNTYIENNLDSPPKLFGIAKELLDCIDVLQQHRLAHGDLQHGNILVVPDGSIKLIDYDGMYVEALTGMGSHELGHSNYQHPRRDAIKAFGPAMDNFSAWVIIASLISLCFDPYLWYQLDGGTERLLFGKGDFANPSASETFRIMQESPHPKVAELGREVRRLLSLSVETVPPVAAGSLSRLAIPSSAAISLGSSTEDHFDTSPAGGQVDVISAGGSWVLDHIQPATPIGFRGSMLVPRLATAVWLLALLTIGLAWAGSYLAPELAIAIAAGVSMIFALTLAVDFWRCEEHQARLER